MAKQTQIQQTKAELFKVKAQDLGVIIAAKRNIDKAGKLHASACLVTITALSGIVICDTFAIYDGLSDETIKAIKSDIDKTVKQKLESYGIKTV